MHSFFHEKKLLTYSILGGAWLINRTAVSDPGWPDHRYTLVDDEKRTYALRYFCEIKDKDDKISTAHQTKKFLNRIDNIIPDVVIFIRKVNIEQHS